MADFFDPPRTNDPIIDDGSQYLNQRWRLWFKSFYQTLITYLTPQGIYVPVLTTAQRDAISILSLRDGLFIYNRTAVSPQMYFNGTWHNITHT